MDKIFIVFSLTATGLFVVTKCSTQCDIPECIHDPPQYHEDVKMFSINDKPLSFTGKLYEVQAPNGSSECFINTTEFISDMFRENIIAVGNIAVNCFIPTLVHFTPLGDKISFSNIWIYFQSVKCQTTFQSISRISKKFDMKVLTLLHTDIIDETTSCFGSDSDDLCHGLLQAGSIMLTSNNIYENKQPNITKMFSCNETFPLMNEVTIYNVSLSKSPEEFAKLFPNIQSLSIAHSPELMTMNFTWNYDYKILEKNLTMMDYFMSMYADVFHINIPRTRYRRGIALEHNEIQSLDRYYFHGPIDMIQLQHNLIKKLRNNTFAKVTELQHIDVSHNEINVVDAGIFSELRDLRYIALKNNTIQMLPPLLFIDLDNLVFIDLSYNKIKDLNLDMFSNMNSLQILHLENNLMEHIGNSDIILSQNSLSKIYLNNNPLSEIPLFLFYASNLEAAFLQNTLVSLRNLTDLTLNVSLQSLMKAVNKQINIVEDYLNFSPENTRLIDLSNSNISTIDLGVDTLALNSHSDKVLTILLKHFNFKLNGNTIVCDCTLNKFLKWVDRKMSVHIFTGNEPFFDNWICKEPKEFLNVPVMSVLPKNTYCKTNINNCPYKCTCYERSISHIIIVDCEGLGISSLPNQMPPGVLDLWFSNNNITSLQIKPYFHRIRQLRLTSNLLEKIEINVLPQLKIIEQLFLDSNFLTHIPEDVTKIKLFAGKEISLANNPLKCDCNSLWLKSWILSSQEYIANWTLIICNHVNGEGQQVIGVKDEDFICTEMYDVIKHVVIPAIICSILISIMFFVIIVIYINRLAVKVLLYKHIGLHPFDNNDTPGYVDLLIIHAPSAEKWVSKNIVQILEDEKFIVCCQSRDFMVGFTYYDNICTISKFSKRTMVVLSDDLMNTQDLFKVCWSESRKKVQEKSSNSFLVVAHNIQIKNLKQNDSLKHIKKGIFLNTNEILFKDKVLYFLHKNKRAPFNQELVLTEKDPWASDLYSNIPSRDSCSDDVFLSYSESDHIFATNELWKFLEKLSCSVILPNRDFVPGYSKEENIRRGIDSSRHTICVLSKNYLNDEWSLFTFRLAVEKSLREKYNHLILIILPITFKNSNIEDEEIKHYVNTHVTLSIDEEKFWDKLKSCIMNSECFISRNHNKINHMNGKNGCDVMKDTMNKNLEEDDASINGHTHKGFEFKQQTQGLSMSPVPVPQAESDLKGAKHKSVSEIFADDSLTVSFV